MTSEYRIADFLSVFQSRFRQSFESVRSLNSSMRFSIGRLFPSRWKDKDDSFGLPAPAAASGGAAGNFL